MIPKLWTDSLLQNFKTYSNRNVVLITDDGGKERKTRLRLRYAYIDNDSITYHLPEGFTLEFMPPPFEIKSEFGTYSAKVISGQDKKSLLYVRTMTMNDGYYAPEKYKDFVSFINEVSKKDNIKVSLLKTQ